MTFLKPHLVLKNLQKTNSLILTFAYTFNPYLRPIMTVEQIEKFLANETIPQNKAIRFEFKKRDPIRGLIVKGRDYDDLKAKNFWRIVTSKNFDAYNKTKDVNLARLFNGSEFSRLSLLTDEF